MEANMIRVLGARQNNLKNVSCEIPRNKITVFTGVSGSGKSSLAYEVIYAEAQRRFLDSLSTYEKSRIKIINKPDVDLVSGLSPTIALQQRKYINNPHSTVGTITDIYDFLRLLFASAGNINCPECDITLEQYTPLQILDKLSRLPTSTHVDICISVYKEHGKPFSYMFKKIRDRGYKKLYINDKLFSLSDDIELDEDKEYRIEVLVESFSLTNSGYKYLAKSLSLAIEVLESVTMRVEISGSDLTQETKRQFYQDFGCPDHHYVLSKLEPFVFSFNYPSTSHCSSCNGVGNAFVTKKELLVKTPKASINRGALKQSLYNPDTPDNPPGIMMYSLAEHYKFDLDTPFCGLPSHIQDILFYGTKGEKIEMKARPTAVRRNPIIGQYMAFLGFLANVERQYQDSIRGSQTGEAVIPSFLKDVMIRSECPECHGNRLKKQFLQVKIAGKNIAEFGKMPMADIMCELEQLSFGGPYASRNYDIVKEITKRVRNILAVGLPYISTFRGSDTLSGGELQRIFLSNHISNELLGMTYIIDEPTIGLHAKDTKLIIDTLQKLRDEGNTVIVVEHDLDIIKSADHIIEMGPAAGERGGKIIFEGTKDEMLESPDSVTASYIKDHIYVFERKKRLEPTDKYIEIFGAKANNLKNVSVKIPLGKLVCVTGVSGSGKSTLIHEVMYKQLRLNMGMAYEEVGTNDGVTGEAHISSVIDINQAPVGKSSRSTPATYLGFFDVIRQLLAKQEAAVEQGYTASSFSLMSKDGLRCDHCAGEGILKNKLQFMADVEVVCPMCNGSRFTPEANSVRYRDKNISEILNMTAEEALDFFAEEKSVYTKLFTMNQIGLGYLKIGQGLNSLSGGELQRLKLASELSRGRGREHNLYILDEPTTGLHMNDIQLLIEQINNLIEQGHSVIVIEHHTNFIEAADYVIDMGPEGGIAGGRVLTTGTPEEIKTNPNSITGKYL